MAEDKIEDIDDLKKSEYYKKAQDPETVEKIKEEFSSKLGTMGMLGATAGSGTISSLIEHAKILYNMVFDSSFKLSSQSKIIILSGLLYFIVPFDLIPDFIPIAGFLDDAAVIAAIVSSLSDEITRYKKYTRNKNPKERREKD